MPEAISTTNSKTAAPRCASFVVRQYEKSDRETVRWLCCQTGFLGEPIDPVFEDRELFADFLTNYYLESEPESAFVLEIDGTVRGYLLGCRKPLTNQWKNFFQNLSIARTLLTKYSKYTRPSRRFIHWILLHGWREVPAAPRRTPHFHINLLPDARSVAGTRGLIDTYLAYLRRCGEKRVYGQMVSFANRRGERMFQRYGFQVLNRSEITKYRRLHPEPVYLCTVIKDLEANDRLYAHSTPTEVAPTSDK